MSAYPDPDTLLDNICKQIEAMNIFADVEVLHGKFRIEDLDTRSFRSPSAFVTMSSATPRIQHAGQVRLMCALAVMIVAKTTDRHISAWQAATKTLELCHRNMWELTQISQPTEFQIIPVVSSSERQKNQTLTALTWKQNLTLSEPQTPAKPVAQTEEVRSHG
ncbi:hypothetical protein [Polycladidibacter hongkongensis]|uniref:hypothetical protein n=1 Tax=Polycladidibacter hongkongensis TaxID=1647556 RepID=UPI00083169CD|nr:hypothetical protein [Pseudovibrio hongkongensis]